MAGRVGKGEDLDLVMEGRGGEGRGGGERGMEGEREREREGGLMTERQPNVHDSVCEIGGRQVAQATCKRSLVTYFDQLVTIPGNLRFCSRTLSYLHTTHIAQAYTLS